MNYSRIKKNKDFQKFFSRGKRSFSPSLTVIYLKSDSVKMGISIGKKHGKSVMRNRIKRLLRVAFDAEAANMAPVAVIFVPKVRESYSLSSFSSDLKHILNKEKLYKA